MDGRHKRIPSPYRWVAVVMLWVWCASQAVCVAHCHGLLTAVFQETVLATAGSENPAQVSHGCCSHRKLRSSETSGGRLRLAETPRSSLVPTSGSSSTRWVIAKSDQGGSVHLGSGTSPCMTDRTHGSQNSDASGNPEIPVTPCATQAVISAGLHLDAPTLVPVALPFPQDSATTTGLIGGLFRLPAIIQVEARWSAPSRPRCDAGFEPAVILGSGLRTLAPPHVG